MQPDTSLKCTPAVDNEWETVVSLQKRRKNCFTRARSPVSPHWNASGVTPHHFLDAAWDFVSSEHSVLHRHQIYASRLLSFRILVKHSYLRTIRERNNFYNIPYPYRMCKIILHIIYFEKRCTWRFEGHLRLTALGKINNLDSRSNIRNTPATLWQRATRPYSCAHTHAN